MTHFQEASFLKKLKHYLPTQAALKDFVHHNPLHAFQDQEFFQAIFSASKIFGIKATLNLNEYRKLHHAGRIKTEYLDRLLHKEKGPDQIDLWKEKMIHGAYPHHTEIRLGRLRDRWKPILKESLDDRAQPLLFRIICSYLDQGIALWNFPFENQGLISAIRTLEQSSFQSFFRSKRVRALVAKPDLTLDTLLKIVVGREDLYEQYLYDQQFAHKGWSGIINAIEDQPETLFYEKNISLRDFIMLELLLEIDVFDHKLGNNWNPLGDHWTGPAEDLFAEVQTNEREEILRLWQLAFEWDYYDEVLAGVHHLNKQERQPAKNKTSFQALFCVDDRECSIRRYFEKVDPDCETYGAPGFFGVSIYFQPHGGKFVEKNCPVPITPKHLIKEVESTHSHQSVPFHDQHSHTFLRGIWLSFSLGLVAGFKMIFDLFRPTMQADIADAFAHMDVNGKLIIKCSDPSLSEHEAQVGYTVPEMVEVVEGILRGIGLTKDFAEIVYIVAHGSSSANNPHHGAHDCGACSGRPGAPNARVFAFMANDPEVRQILRERKIDIPDSTHFIAAMHDTASDEIGYYDLGCLSPQSRASHDHHLRKIEEALDLNAKERARRFASIDIKQDIQKIRRAIKKRSFSYFEPRPELGHGTNALCFVGARARMKGLFLDRRAFLQSYDYRQDPDGRILAGVLAPLPGVCGGINLEYYFSRMDNEKMGAGTKLPHNVAGLIGVTNSSDGDLRPGLPLQMIENHDPVRLLMVIEHRPEVVRQILDDSPANREWFLKGWLHLIVSSPEDKQLYHFKDGNFEPYLPLATPRKVANSEHAIHSHPEMKSNQILDATQENIPVHLYGESADQNN